MLWNLSAFERRTALIAAQGTMTYGDLCAAAERIAAPLRERTLVFLLARNSPAAMAGYVGFLQHGIVPVMVDAALDTELLMALRTAYRPSYVWIPAERVAEFGAAREVLHWEEYVLLDLA